MFFSLLELGTETEIEAGTDGSDRNEFPLRYHCFSDNATFSFPELKLLRVVFL